MAIQTINVGASANDGTGDPLRTAFQKVNDNFAEESTVQQYKFLLSQSGGDDPQTATSGTLTKGVTYEIVSFETGDDFTISGAPNNTVGTKWIANGIAPTWSNGSEIGWNNGAPIVDLNFGVSLSGIRLERFTAGIYKIFSDGLFVEDKVFFPFNSAFPQTADAAGKYGARWVSENEIGIDVLDGGGDYSDNYLVRTPIIFEINN